METQVFEIDFTKMQGVTDIDRDCLDVNPPWESQEVYMISEVTEFSNKLQSLNKIISSSYNDVLFNGIICIIPVLLQFFISYLFSSTITIVKPPDQTIDLDINHTNLA